MLRDFSKLYQKFKSCLSSLLLQMPKIYLKRRLGKNLGRGVQINLDLISSGGVVPEISGTRPFSGYPNPTFPGRVCTRPYPNL